MEKVWVVVADSTRSRIFEAVAPARAKLCEIDNLVNPEGHEQSDESVTDVLGPFHGGGQQHHGHIETAREENSVEQAGAVFARTISEVLRNARTDHRYDGLRVFAPPKFLGLLRQNLDKETRELLEMETAKDISWLDMHEIERYL